MTRALIHGVGLAVVCAVAAYWLVRIATPAPSVAPAPMTPPPPRDPDPVLSARMFGKVQTPAEAAPSNMQLVGVVAAGPLSAAAISVDGRPARAYLLGQRVINDLTLRSVDGDGVQLGNTSGVTQAIKMPKAAVAQFANQPPPTVYTIDHGMISSPTVDGPPTTIANTPSAQSRPQMPRDIQQVQPQVSVGNPQAAVNPPPQVQQLVPPPPPQSP